MSKESLKKLQRLQLPVVTVPRLLMNDFNRVAVEQVASCLEAAS